jgi:DNA topoisomerase IB
MQSRELQRERELAEALLEDQRVTETKKVRDSHGTWTRLVAGKTRAKPGDARRMSVTSGKEETKPFDIPPNAYELYAAIDRKDLP